MNKLCFIVVLQCFLISAYAQDSRTCYFPRKKEHPTQMPDKRNVWVFLLAGQSNMAGRGLVEPMDTVPDDRILALDRDMAIVLAKEPLHFYEPNLTGLDCGLSFGRQLLETIDPSITILLIPTAVGGSSSHQWLGDSLHRNVKLMRNFRDRVEIAKRYGTVKGILWHQGESDTQRKLIQGYQTRIQKIFTEFRAACGDTTLPILIGELGSYSENKKNWKAINKEIHRYAKKDKHAVVIDTGDLKSKDDRIHFNSEGQRLMGKRMANAFAALKNP